VPQTSVTACFGDVTSDEVLEHLGIDRAGPAK
jgi:hypothetical protein